MKLQQSYSKQKPNGKARLNKVKPKKVEFKKLAEERRKKGEENLKLVKGITTVELLKEKEFVLMCCNV
jgi:hypothetical protein